MTHTERKLFRRYLDTGDTAGMETLLVKANANSLIRKMKSLSVQSERLRREREKRQVLSMKEYNRACQSVYGKF